MSMTFATAKPAGNKLVNRFKANTATTFKSLPSSLSSQNVNIEQQQAAPSLDGSNTVGARPSVTSNPEAINQPQTPNDYFHSDGTDGIKEMSQAANDGIAAQQALKRKDAQAAQDASINGAFANTSATLSNGQYNGALPSGLSAEQMQNANQIFQIGKQRNLSDEDIRIAIMTAMTESSLHNINGGDRDSVGLFQQRPSQGWGTVDQIMNPTYSIGKFYDSLKGATGNTPWERAQAVQRSAFGDGSNYKNNWSLANSAWNALAQQGVSTPTRGANSSLNWINANNGKYHDFDHAFGAQCVDLYNFYMTGFVGGQSSVGQVNYASELWQRHDTSTLVQIGKNQRPQMGDIAIWSNSFNGQGGHVAIVAQDNGNGTIRVLNANATSAGPNGNTVMSNLSTGSLLGYLRPRKLMK